MFASIRCYAVQSAQTQQLAGLVEAEFADLIAAQPGFVWYAFLDCGEGAAMTISVFHERAQAAGSRELARRWTEERLGEIDLTLTEAVNGGSRSAERRRGCGTGAGPISRVRRYKLSDTDLGEVVWRLVDSGLAERIAELDGFVAYFVFSSGAGELVTVSEFRDRAAATASDELALAFVRDELDSLDIERLDTIGGGEVAVSRVTAALLEPIRA